MKKLFFLIPTLSGGGAEKVLVDLVNNLDKNKYDITVKTLLSGGVFEEKLNLNIKYSSVINIKNNFLRKVFFYIISYILPSRMAYRIVADDEYDVEISYLEGVTTKLLIASNNVNSKKIAFVHTDFSKNYDLFKIYKTYNDCLNSYKLYDGVVFVSKQAKLGFENKIGELSRSIVLHNVIDQKSINELSKKEITQKKSGLFTFISVGRLCTQKGFDRLIEATSWLNDEKFDFEVWIVGEGPDRKELAALIEKYNLQNVKLLGFKKNPYKYISAADMFICSSRVEGYSTVVTEALILQTPVVTTNCAGMDEILDNGNYGMITENSTNGIYEGMKEILTDPNTYQMYFKLAQERSKFFSIERNISDYEKLFESGGTL